MKNTLDIFKEQRSYTLALLEKLLQFLKQGSEAGVAIDPQLESKVRKTIECVASEKLRVALVGGFSEGKTSIAAAWMEKLDKSSMNISHQESSNEIKVYEVGEEFVLIDTPGLFGFKEQENSSTHAIEKFRDITKKYVSEAHLVLFVMNPTNPIKESHKDDLNWLLRTLNLLPRTVFVLSRFDEVADLEEDDDYHGNLQIKQNNVIGSLRRLIQLSDKEANELSVVAVAANPFDLGMEHWLANLEQFQSLSRISELQAATAAKIRQNGGSAALANEMRVGVIEDVLHKQLPVVDCALTQISEEVNRIDAFRVQYKSKLDATNRKIEDVRIGLREFSTRYFSDLILQAKGCSMETFGEFFEGEIGSQGINISSRLQNEFSRQTQAIHYDVQKMQVDFDSEVNHFNTMINSLSKQGINQLLSKNLINRSTVLTARDGIVTAAKTVGMDIGKYLKFKPWGAAKLAKGANGAIAIIGLAIEAWDSWEQNKREAEFKKSISQMVDNFEKQRLELINLVNSDEFKEQFFPEYLDLQKSTAALEQELEKHRAQERQFEEWKHAGMTIKQEFRKLA